MEIEHAKLSPRDLFTRTKENVTELSIPLLFQRKTHSRTKCFYVAKILVPNLNIVSERRFVVIEDIHKHDNIKITNTLNSRQNKD